MTTPHPLSDLVSDPQRLVSVLDDKQPLVVTHDGEAVAVVLTPEAYRRLSRELELLRLLALGEIECAAEVGHGIDEVLADCDLLLDEN